MRKILFGLIILLLVCTGIGLGLSMSPTKKLDEVKRETTSKPVILIVVDSLMTEPLKKSIEEGKAPAFSFLINNGKLIPDVISSYPTMSVAIDSTLLTGTYPDQHKVPGLIWFKKDENRMVSYGSGIREIWNNGVKHVVHDSIINLNKNDLSKDVNTIHEELANHRIPSASINGLIFRGKNQQPFNVPKLISMSGLLPNEIEMNGPTILSLGTLSQYNPENDRHKFVWNRMGVNNTFTANELSYLIKQNRLPAFTLAYLPDADASIHKHGPDDLKGIEKADAALQKIMNNYSSWEEAIQEVTWIVLGDSGQSRVKKEKGTALIDLNELLQNYTFWDSKHVNAQLAFAINERMAYIHVNDEHIEITDIVDILKKDERIGFIAWKDEDSNFVVSPEREQAFQFSANGPYSDEFEQAWNIAGDMSILDLKIQDDKKIVYRNYPDALARLYGALHSHDGRYLIVDAKPSYEFIEEHSHDHAGGGAHGSLHKVDSIVPLMVAGTDEIPEIHRLVDVKDWIVQLVDGS